MFCRGAKNVSDATGVTGKVKKKLDGAKEKGNRERQKIARKRTRRAAATP